jgi:hypothetical protein
MQGFEGMALMAVQLGDAQSLQKGYEALMQEFRWVLGRCPPNWNLLVMDELIPVLRISPEFFHPTTDHIP